MSSLFATLKWQLPSNILYLLCIRPHSITLYYHKTDIRYNPLNSRFFCGCFEWVNIRYVSVFIYSYVILCQCLNILVNKFFYTKTILGSFCFSKKFEYIKSGSWNWKLEFTAQLEGSLTGWKIYLQRAQLSYHSSRQLESSLPLPGYSSCKRVYFSNS